MMVVSTLSWHSQAQTTSYKWKLAQADFCPRLFGKEVLGPALQASTHVDRNCFDEAITKDILVVLL